MTKTYKLTAAEIGLISVALTDHAKKCKQWAKDLNNDETPNFALFYATSADKLNHLSSIFLKADSIEVIE